MTGGAASWVAWLTIISLIVGTIAAVLTISGAAKKKRAEDDQAKQANYNKGFEDGKAHMQPAIDLLNSQLADCTRDRDNAQRRSDGYEGRYNDLRDRER